MGSTLRAQPVANKGAIAGKLRQQVWPLFENGTIKPVIYQTLPMNEAQAAHDILRGGAHVGKVVLEVP